MNSWKNYLRIPFFSGRVRNKWVTSGFGLKVMLGGFFSQMTVCCSYLPLIKTLDKLAEIIEA